MISLPQTVSSRLRRYSMSATFWQDVAVHAGLIVVGTFLVWPVLKPDFPPGVDTPTFLHLSWIVERALQGGLANPLIDPYWYGGYPYLLAYSPLGYGTVGLVSSLPGLGLVPVYDTFLVLGYVGIGIATYWLALELGLRRLPSAVAAFVVLSAYPLLAAIFLWGWFTTLLAMPMALFGLALLLRSQDRQQANGGLLRRAFHGDCADASDDGVCVRHGCRDIRSYRLRDSGLRQENAAQDERYNCGRGASSGRAVAGALVHVSAWSGLPPRGRGTLCTDTGEFQGRNFATGIYWSLQPSVVCRRDACTVEHHRLCACHHARIAVDSHRCACVGFLSRRLGFRHQSTYQSFPV